MPGAGPNGDQVSSRHFAADRARVGDHLRLGVWGAGARRGGARRRDQERVRSQAVLGGGALEDWGRGWVGVRLKGAWPWKGRGRGAGSRE